MADYDLIAAKWKEIYVTSDGTVMYDGARLYPSEIVKPKEPKKSSRTINLRRD